MDDIKREIIKGLIYISITGVPTFLITDSHNKSEIKVNEEKIEELSSSSTEYRMRYEEGIKEIEYLKDEIISNNTVLREIEQNLFLLKNEYNVLEEKYNQLISPSGFHYNQELFDEESYIKNYKTGDKLEYSLLTTKLILDFIRVTDRGPLIKIVGCSNYITINSVKIYEGGEELILCTYTNPFKMKYTCNSCEEDDDLNPTESEKISIELMSFNVDEQTFQIKHSKKISF